MYYILCITYYIFGFCITYLVSVLLKMQNLYWVLPNFTRPIISITYSTKKVFHKILNLNFQKYWTFLWRILRPSENRRITGKSWICIPCRTLSPLSSRVNLHKNQFEVMLKNLRNTEKTVSVFCIMEFVFYVLCSTEFVFSVLCRYSALCIMYYVF